MAKDDYNVLVFRILTYFYGCLKRATLFDEDIFKKVIGADTIPEGYIVDVLRMMENDGLITGLTFIKAWGNEYILISDLKDIYITSKGIEYIQDNKTMKKIKEKIMENTADNITTLIKLVF